MNSLWSPARLNETTQKNVDESSKVLNSQIQGHTKAHKAFRDQEEKNFNENINVQEKQYNNSRYQNDEYEVFHINGDFEERARF